MLESLETRALLTTSYTYPFGATVDDTGEYMLGKIAVNVVLMESDPTIAPGDNGTLQQINPFSGQISNITYQPEDWNQSAIDGVKNKVSLAMQWWEDTFKHMYPNAPADSLTFDINFKYADAPVHTGYEPIARLSDDFLSDSTTSATGSIAVSSVGSATQFNGGSGLSTVDDFYAGKYIQFASGPLKGQRGQVISYVGATHTFTFAPNTFTGAPNVGNSFQIDQGWMYDFLDKTGFAKTGIYSTDMRSFNDYTRQQDNADWAFTIFVVNNANDLANSDGFFGIGGSYSQAYSYPGGQFEIVPASRPVMTFAHETGHQFWAMDEYTGASSSADYRGYYDTQNYNQEDNPDFFGTNEIQTIAPFQGSVTGGTFALTINLSTGKTFTTAPIAYNAGAVTIQNAIDTVARANVSGYLNGDILVSGTPLTGGSGIKLNFSGNSVRWANQSMTSIDGTNLTGGGTAGTVSETQRGAAPKSKQLPSIMATDHTNRVPQTHIQSDSFNTLTIDPYTAATIGWQDSDHDGIMDVLDVPLTLTGTGSYDPVGGVYSFQGATHVNTLPNQNPSGTQDDITINQISELQYQIDGGPWFQAVAFDARTYSRSVSFNIPLNAGSTIHFRTRDDQNGLTSNVFTGSTDTPTNDMLPGIEGTTYLDQNGNAKWDSGEPLQSGVVVTVADQNNQPLALQHKIEPDDYADGWVLDSVDPAATVSAIGLNSGSGDVAASGYAGVPAAGKVLTATDFAGDPLPAWNEQRQLRVDFESPVSTVSIKAYGTSATTPSYARLDAYNSSRQVVARFTSGALTSSGFTTMMVSRATSDIKYVIAYGWENTSVVLDTLTWGPPNSTTSDSNGAFSLNYLPDGTYHVHILPMSDYHVTNPASGDAVIVVSGGVTTSNMNFGVATDATPTYKFHNSANRYNVNPSEDSQITALDALMIINFINAHPGGNGTIPVSLDPNDIGYIDVVPDGVCAANDALSVINYINANPNREADANSAIPVTPAAAAASDSGGTTSSDGGANATPTSATPTSSTPTSAAGEGEYAVPSPQSSSDYYAQQPAHAVFIRGTGPCNCAACRAARGEAVTQIVQPAEQVVPPAPTAAVDGSAGFDTTLDLIAADVSQLKASASA